MCFLCGEGRVEIFGAIDYLYYPKLWGGLLDMPPRVRFDVPTLTHHLNAEDPMTLILRSHLYVETILLERIEAALADRNVLDVARLSFSLKASLAVALGKIDAADAQAFTVLNKLRNKFAHDLATQLNDQNEQDLHKALSPERRGIVELMRAGRQLPLLGRLRCDLIALIIERE